MKIVLFAHPDFLGQQSMPRFTNMLADGMREKGYKIEIYSPNEFFFKLPVPFPLKKWLGYIDQFLIFPTSVKKRIKNNNGTLYVFTDHALGMWVPIVKHLPHIIICHDFLAQRSAGGEILQNPTGWSGRVYQRLIHKGYSVGKNFISISKKTQQDLHEFLGHIPAISKVIYNGLNKVFIPISSQQARQVLSKKTGINLSNGYILHIGGNQWYKNRVGVIKIYNKWRSGYNSPIPLLMIGADPSSELGQEIDNSIYKDSIHVLTDIGDEYINVAYSGALLLLFPSIAEGFGWPIAEAMASGCPVITTNEAPMTEVGGNSASYIPAMPLTEHETNLWSSEAAKKVDEIINVSDKERLEIINNGLNNSKRFDTASAINAIEEVFCEVFE